MNVKHDDRKDWTEKQKIGIVGFGTTEEQCVAIGRVGSGCPSQDHPSPSLRTGLARFPRIRLALYLSCAVFSIREFSGMEQVVTIAAQDKRFPVSGCHQPLPCCFSLSDIFHFPNVVYLKGSGSRLAIFTFARVQSSDEFRSTERECEDIGRYIHFCVVGCHWFKVFGLEHSDNSCLFLSLHGKDQSLFCFEPFDDFIRAW